MDQDIRNASPNVYDFIDFSALNYGEILSFITPEIRKTVRSLEKLFKKKESLIIGGKFLQRCLQEGLLPKFTEISYQWICSVTSIYDPNLLKSRRLFNFYKSPRRFYYFFWR